VSLRNCRTGRNRLPCTETLVALIWNSQPKPLSGNGFVH
jgi:hypothetical protein